MNIGKAIEALKQQKRVQRAGWNGKGMWIIMLNPGWDDNPSDASEDCTLNSNTHIADGEERDVEPCIALKTAANTLQPGWNASTPDLLADDWQIVGELADLSSEATREAAIDKITAAVLDAVAPEGSDIQEHQQIRDAVAKALV